MSGEVLLNGTAGWLFVAFSVLALASALAVVVARSPVHSALYLLLSFLLVACIFILQQAEFVGAVQILVYAGGIMVLFLFVVMLVNPRTVRTGTAFPSTPQPNPHRANRPHVPVSPPASGWPGRAW